MKVKVEFDLTPKEARKLMGLPDVEQMQVELVKQIQEKIKSDIQILSDPQVLMERYLPLGVQGLEQFQKLMTGFASARSGGGKK